MLLRRLRLNDRNSGLIVGGLPSSCFAYSSYGVCNYETAIFFNRPMIVATDKHNAATYCAHPGGEQPRFKRPQNLVKPIDDWIIGSNGHESLILAVVNAIK